jgi:hypothetical protein
MNNSYEQAQAAAETVRQAVDKYNSVINRAANIVEDGQKEFNEALNVLVGTGVEVVFDTPDYSNGILPRTTIDKITYKVDL